LHILFLVQSAADALSTHQSFPTRRSSDLEGSTFKSKFANALTNMMIGSLGIAAAQNKLSVGYGSEAGYMDPMIAKMCARYCKNRSEEHTSELKSPDHLVCRLLLAKKTLKI